MIAYVLPCLLLTGFFYLIYRNSPKHAWQFLAVVAASILVCFLKPSRIFFPIAIVGGIVATFAIIIKSRKIREAAIQNWFAQNGFQRTDFPAVSNLFTIYNVGTSNRWAYKNQLAFHHKTVPYILAINYESTRSNNTTSITFHCAYCFSSQTDIALLEQKFRAAKEATTSTNLFKSQLGYFNVKACDIFKTPAGELVVRWRVPHSVEGYNDRHNWIINALKNPVNLPLAISLL